MDKPLDNKALLHGITLEQIVVSLVGHFGWDVLGERIRIDCFNSNPSIKSSLTFLRRMPWARQKVERLYLEEYLRQNAKRV